MPGPIIRLTPPTSEALTGTLIASPEWQPTTRNEQLWWEITSSSDGPTVQQAVDTFGLIEPDFPGVTASELPAEEERSGTYALTVLESMRDQLTSEQVAALDAYLADGTTVATMTADGTIELTGDTTPTTGPSGWRRSPQATEIGRYSALLAEVQQARDAHLPGRPKQQSYELRFTTNQHKTGMESTAEGSLTKKCVISVHPNFRADHPSDDKIRFFFAHELFHCMQFHWASHASVWMPHAWVFDGSADWAAPDLYRNTSIDFNDIPRRLVREFSAAARGAGL
jgi:hypothetical protein